MWRKVESNYCKNGDLIFLFFKEKCEDDELVEMERKIMQLSKVFHSFHIIFYSDVTFFFFFIIFFMETRTICMCFLWNYYFVISLVTYILGSLLGSADVPHADCPHSRDAVPQLFHMLFTFSFRLVWWEHSNLYFAYTIRVELKVLYWSSDEIGLPAQRRKITGTSPDS